MAARKKKTPAEPVTETDPTGAIGTDLAAKDGSETGRMDPTEPAKAEVGISEAETAAQPPMGSDDTNTDPAAEVPAPAELSAAEPAPEPPADPVVVVDSPYSGGIPLMVNGDLVVVPNGVPTRIPRSHLGALRDSGCAFTEV